MKTLLIATEPRARQLLEDRLRRHSCDVAVVDGVEAACVAARADAYRLIVLADDDSGGAVLDWCRRIRSTPACRDCVVLAVLREGDPEPEFVQRLLGAGANDVACGLEGAGLDTRLLIARHLADTPVNGQCCLNASAPGLLADAWFDIEDLPFGVYRTTLDGRFIAANATLVRMLGYENEEELLRLDLVRDVYQDPTVRDQILQRGIEHLDTYELRWKRKDGTPIIIRAVGCLVRDQAGEPIHIEGFIEDITTRRLSEIAIRESEARFRAIFRNAAVGVVLTDLKGRIVQTNAAFAEMLGQSVDDLTGRTVHEISAEDEIKAEVQVFRGLIAGERDRVQIEKPYRRRDGRTVWGRLSASLLTDNEGAPHFIVAVVEDVTEHHLADDRLRQSEERYRLVTDGVADMIWTAKLPEPFDVTAVEGDPAEVPATLLPNLQFTFASPSSKHVLGYTPEEMLELSATDVLTEKAMERIARGLQGVFRRMARRIPPPAGMTFEVDHIAKDGSLRCCEIVPSLLLDEKGRVFGALGVTRDVTDRRKAERAVRQSEARLRSLFENLPDFVILVDGNAKIQYVNRGVPNLTAEQLVGGTGFDFIAPERRGDCREAFEQAFATNETQTVEALDVFGRWWACRVVPLAEFDMPEKAMIICTDVTDERRAREAVEKEQRLLRRLLDLQERDRRLVAYEIHDGFAQQLTGALFSLEAFSRLRESDDSANWNLFREGVGLISQSIDETRRLISGLRPPILDERGILAAVEYLAYENEQAGELEVDFRSEVRFERLAAPLENTLFRIIQELLTNARRHSQCGRARVELVQDGEQIRVSVRDEGVGFCPDSVAENRFGLQGIRERARLFGGKVTIETAPNKGTCVTVELPLVELAGPFADEDEDRTP